MALSLLCRVQQDRPHKPCGGTDEEDPPGPCECACHRRIPARFFVTTEGPGGWTAIATDDAESAAVELFTGAREVDRLEFFLWLADKTSGRAPTHLVEPIREPPWWWCGVCHPVVWGVGGCSDCTAVRGDGPETPL